MDDATRAGEGDVLNMLDSIRAWILRTRNSVTGTHPNSLPAKLPSDLQENDEKNTSLTESTPLPPTTSGDGPLMSQLRTENLKLKNDLEISKAKRLSLEEQTRSCRERMRELVVEHQKYDAKIKHLNAIVQKYGTPYTGPMDDYFCIEFSSLPYTVFSIVQRYYQATTVSLKHTQSDPPSLVQSQSHWLGNWSRLTPKLRNYSAQGAIFEVLNAYFFSRPLFPVEAPFRTLLSDFEVKLEVCPEISTADLLEWRKRTVAAAKALGWNSTEYAELAAKEITDRLEPALSQNGVQMTLPKQEKLQREVHRLCEKTLALAMEMRSNRAIFKVIIPYSKTKVAAEDTDNVMVAIEGDETSDSDSYRVSFTAFGGLEKTSLTPWEDQETETMVKSQVVCYAG